MTQINIFQVNGWKYMLGLAGIPSLIQFFGFLFMPESPRWLVSRGKIEDARRVLHRIRDPDDNPDEELREIRLAVEEEQRAVANVNVIRKVFPVGLYQCQGLRPSVLGILHSLNKESYNAWLSAANVPTNCWHQHCHVLLGQDHLHGGILRRQPGNLDGRRSGIR